MGYQTHWFDDKDNVHSFDFSNSLFITEGQVDKNIPIRDDCRYILHYCRSPKYIPLIEKGHCIILQVYNDFVLKRSDLVKVDTCIYYDLFRKRIYMPWATDLLPDEIDALKNEVPTIKKNKSVSWVGSMGDGLYGNIHQLEPFKRACAENRVEFHQRIGISIEENRKLVQQSYLAPAIVGQWQEEVGYIPCRIFKNISYGQMGVTNSKTVYELFDKKIVYNPDTYQLFYDARKRVETMTTQDLYELMDVVKTKHTFINRIQNLLDFLKLVEVTYSPQSKTNAPSESHINADFFKNIVNKFEIEVLIEIGENAGQTIAQALPLCREIYAIKSSIPTYAFTAQRFKHDKHVHVFPGEPADILSKILPFIKGKILFVLDSHGDLTTTTRRKYNPIFEEIRAIIACSINDGVILINNMHYFKQGGYPPEQFIRDAISDINSKYQFISQDNYLCAFIQN